MKSSIRPIDLSKVKTYPIRERKSLVRVEDFGKVFASGSEFNDFVEGLPNILKGKDLKHIIDAVVHAYQNKKYVIVMMGAHVVKCGLSPFIIDMVHRGVIKAIAMNGGASIHDFEIAMIGQTSEDVKKGICSGRFGMVEETGKIMNEAIKERVKRGVGMGKALGEKMTERKFPYLQHSIVAACVKRNIPITVHVAIGTDFIHQHPSACGSALGEGSYIDFRIFTSVVSKLGNGGVVLNFGSAVILPEVFLKAFAIARNIGYDVNNFTAVNFDMVQHYRPNMNIVKRPTHGRSRGYSITGHHEIMIPLLMRAIAEKIDSGEINKK